jgi:anti-sigma regulatory factor (Ser/Thr protein kinase)
MLFATLTKICPEETPIELEITVFNERLEIEIWDWGKPFDFKRS